MGIDFRRPRHIRGFRLGEVLVWDFTSKPLVEKTVSGSVVTFSDGADDVPLKKCEVTIAPTLDGVSSVDVVQTGKNLLDKSLLESGTFNTSGTNVTNNRRVRSAWTSIKDGEEYIYSVETGLQVYAYQVKDENNNILLHKDITVHGYTTNFTVPTGGKYVRVAFAKSDATQTLDVSEVTQPQLEVGSTATAYEPYTAPTTKTAALGRTIYGGTADIVNGTGTAYGYVSGTWGTMAGSSLTPPTGYIIKSFNITSAVADYSKRSQSLGNIPLNNVATDASAHYTFQSQGRYIYVCMPENTASETVISIAYPLETPEDFTFETIPINSRLGDNTLWGDGALSVTYYAYAN